MLATSRIRVALLPVVLIGASFWLACACAAAAVPDGPYVVRDASGGWQALSVMVTPEGERRVSQTVKPRGEIIVPAVGGIPAFAVKLRDVAKPAPDAVKVSAKVPWFVVADTHGEYDILVPHLLKHGIVDDQ